MLGVRPNDHRRRFGCRDGEASQAGAAAHPGGTRAAAAAAATTKSARERAADRSSSARRNLGGFSKNGRRQTSERVGRAPRRTGRGASAEARGGAW